MPKEVTRYVGRPVERELWGHAAGRCEFTGCNKPLWKSSVTQEGVNIAQMAHIYSFSDAGPRGNEGVSDDELNSASNLMLVCHECHQTIDQENDGGRYTAELLQSWKAEHERRVEIVTGIAADRGSHVVLYGANIGQHSSPLQFREAAEALFPNRYPAEDRAIVLGRTNSFSQDRDQAFYTEEARHLIGRFGQRVHERLAEGSVAHMSVFGLAPQPLLILLGSLITDIADADVYQRHREPEPSWQWPDMPTGTLGLDLHEPASTSGPPALVLALTDRVAPARIARVLGPDISLWQATVRQPGQDILKSRDQLSEFREGMRAVIRRIEEVHGKEALLHVFPVMGVAFAIELGRIRQPEANQPWRIYDQVGERGDFIHALDIPRGTSR